MRTNASLMAKTAACRKGSQDGWPSQRHAATRDLSVTGLSARPCLDLCGSEVKGRSGRSGVGVQAGRGADGGLGGTGLA